MSPTVNPGVPLPATRAYATLCRGREGEKYASSPMMKKAKPRVARANNGTRRLMTNPHTHYQFAGDDPGTQGRNANSDGQRLCFTSSPAMSTPYHPPPLVYFRLCCYF